MKTTPFTEKHIALGAKMHEFAGYNMPIEYSGIIGRISGNSCRLPPAHFRIVLVM